MIVSLAGRLHLSNKQTRLRYLMLGSPLASVSIPGAQGHCLRVCSAVQTHEFDISNVLYLVSCATIKDIEVKKNIKFDISESSLPIHVLTGTMGDTIVLY
ncbi:uncharacterized protein LOC107423708 isoform X2 [Ziziphus jujuba]|uniref:Uncharacterized protein LOC107423708 isoform X2 n=1 Tax=Ziziphus jujuba TaxID=326968 RepID=A0ABM3IXA9_ZIZJJ|nr:uncharacterized protein LOC125424303 isoform X2 [Ziziphus jujuba var. spinosa]XP_048337301.1 uncharacterized protein LOC107423708 isoform X2 [Ziziphus jujuba]